MPLTDEQVRQFQENGVLAAEGVVTDDNLAPVIAEYEAWIDARARALHAEGKIGDLFPEETFEKRFARLYEQSTEIEKSMDVMYVRGRALFEFLRCDNLLDAVESLLGTSEITCNPIQHIRAKVPSAEMGNNYYNVPWHQDLGVTTEDADESNILTCWVALADATVENGCMEVLPGVFKTGLLPHRAGPGGATIKEEAMPDVAPLPVPVKKGGVVFMHRLTPHRSTPNFTDGVRWSLDLRYQPTGQPTGRAWWPEFVARSIANPGSVLTDYELWRDRWIEALAHSANIGAKHRTS
ncbi:MAG: phytanoyl-CoA dioxygenase family protein [Capsulimonadales bacterium]|nr:phytanoyl-CoA dioxygenase family protein [Capsulimonadales bacterium]